MASGVGPRIIALRTERGWEQKELAMHARVSREWLSRVETGNLKNPGAERIHQIAKALRVSSEYLLTGERTESERLLPLPEDDTGELATLASFHKGLRRQAVRIVQAMLREDDEGSEDWRKDGNQGRKGETG